MDGSRKAPISVLLVLSLILSTATAGAGLGDLVAGDLPPVNVLGRGLYKTMTDAIEAAKDGDVILVGAGIYDEPVIIDKELTLIGEGPDTIYTTTMFVSASTTIQNHTFQGIYNGDWNRAAGITTFPAGTAMNVIQRVTVRNCTFQNCQHGVYLFGAANCVVEYCNFTNCWRGVSIQNHDPVLNLRLSSYNTIRYCNFTNMRENNGWEGEAVAINNTDYNKVIDCYMDNCPWGVMINRGDYNTVEDCEIVNSTKDPLYFYGIGTKVTAHNNTLRDSKGCVAVRKCVNVEFTENTIENCSAPVSVIDSNTFTFYNNTINGSSVLLKRSTKGTFTSNRFTSSKTLAFDLVTTSKAHYDHAIDTSNEVNGNPIHYYFDQANPVVNDTTVGAAYFAYCTNPNVTRVDVEDGDGVLLVDSPNCNITANITNCIRGVVAVNSGSGRLDKCRIDASTRGQSGISLRDCEDLTVHDTRMTIPNGKPAWRLEGDDIYRCYNTTFPYNSVIANLNGGGELWVFSNLTVRVYENETIAPMAGVEGRLTQDGVAVYNTLHYGGSDPTTGTDGTFGPFTLLDRVYKKFHIPIERIHNLDLWLGADATWSKAVTSINMSRDRLLEFETTDIWRPSVPGGFTVTDIPEEDALEVTWVLNADDTVTYYLWSNISGTWVLLDSLTASVDTYRIDQGLVHGVSYYFSLSAEDEVPLESGRTGVGMVTHVDGLPPAPPLGLKATEVKGTELTLEWQANDEPDLVGYRVYMNATGGDENGPWVLLTASAGITATTLRATGLTSETVYHFVVTAIDERPNESPNSQVLTVTTADITPPLAPVLDALPTYTNVANRAITGTGEPGSTLRLLLNGLVVDESIVPETGEFSVDMALVEGTNVITARCTDPSGNVGPLSGEVITILDQEAPDAPTLGELPELTNVVEHVVPGTAEAFSQVRVLLNGEVVDTISIGADGDFEVTITLEEGGNTLTAEATDRAMNTGPRTPVIDVVLDTIAPEVPSLDPLPEYTNEKEHMVTGTAEPLSLVELMVGGSVVASSSALTGGAYSIDLVLSGRRTVVSTRATDAAGNVGDASQTWTVILDQEPPSAAAGEDLEVVEGETVTFDGTASTDNEGIASYLWSFELDGSEVTLEGKSPTYTFEDPVTLTVTLRVTDLAGNTGEDTVEVVIKFDNVPPILRRDTLNPTKGNTKTKFTFTVEFADGDGDSGEVWVVIDGERYLMTPDPDDTDTTDGQTFTYETKLSQGEHTYYFTGRDSFGWDAEGPSAGEDKAKSSPDIDKKQVSESPGPGATLALLAMLSVVLLLRRRRPVLRRS